MMVFLSILAIILTGLLLLTAVAVDIGRIVYARGEVGKAADAAALIAASRIDVATYQETREILFLPDVYNMAQTLHFDELGLLAPAVHLAWR
jgi:xanthine/uracil/vitamin C permease (AzgA family)